ncbi:hypothetical protein [Azospirillum thermophilum]|uniref:Uncharacterized protein n=1 Tax=Azospirillum thermophilum TaxID=2202148 RepID=A0A2S2CKI1_9PROT|nr:hypothetical protein [Azospirillum thermophilum]AWK85004.1 hypothetical protein DEW08_01355 [Azospirillum thermophilum]
MEDPLLSVGRLSGPDRRAVRAAKDEAAGVPDALVAAACAHVRARSRGLDASPWPAHEEVLDGTPDLRALFAAVDNWSRLKREVERNRRAAVRRWRSLGAALLTCR